MRPSRTYGQIVRANLFTRFNALLGSLWVLTLVIGPLQDAFFGLILLANLAIGIFEEVRAKLTLDRLALLHAPRAHVVRGGVVTDVPAAEVAEGDVLRLGEGEEAVADGTLLDGESLEMNESLLTGESRPVAKVPGQRVLAGTFAVAGTASYQVTGVGAGSYAGRMTAQAREFQLVRSDLMQGINRILQVITWVIAPMALLLVWSQLRANPSLPEALRASIAGVITLVPEGLVLLTSLSLAVAIVRLGRRGVLVQQLAAVEMLARASVVCIDKTGTLTDGSLQLERMEPLGPEADLRPQLAALVAQERGELSQLAGSLPAAPAWTAVERVPFSSERRWSATRFEEAGTLVLGAPDALLAPDQPAARRAVDLAAEGRRVLLLGAAAGPGAEVRPLGLLVLREGLREGAREVLARLREEGVQVAVLSGDHPATVSAVVRALGLAPEDLLELRGRADPEDKVAAIRRYQADGHEVAMVGDGVNDVLALKAADIGLAVGTGSPAARAIAAVVMLEGDFASIPPIIREGRRVIANVERLARLFLTKTTYAALLGLGAVAFTLPFPFLPRHLTLIAAFTIGIPAFFLALAPSADRVRAGFLRRVTAFALPVGLVAAAATFGGYYLALDDPRVGLDEARTAATMVLAGIGVWILSILARPLTPARRLLVAGMATALLAAAVLPATRFLFGIDLPHPLVGLAAVGLVVLGGLVLEAGLRVRGWAIRLWAAVRPGRRRPKGPAARRDGALPWASAQERTGGISDANS